MKEHLVTVENRKFTYVAGISFVSVTERLPKNSQYALLKPLSFVVERTTEDILGLVTREIRNRIELERGSTNGQGKV